MVAGDARDTRTFKAHSSNVNTVRLLGGVLVSGGFYDKRAKVWELEDGGAACVATLEHEAMVLGVAVLPSGAVAAVGSGSAGVRAWRAKQ